jgi:MFS family permease
MLSVVRPVLQVLLAASLLEGALSVLSPLISLQMLRLEASTVLIGIVSAAYFLGFLLGTLTGHAVIDRVGHVRAFGALAVLAVDATILHIVLPVPWIWILFRAVTGFSMAGLFIVIESWLNDKATVETRGRILAVYMVASWAASGVGPQALNIPDPEGRILFCLSAVLLSLSVIPMALTRVGNPETRDRAHFGIARLWRISPLGVLACSVSGLMTSSFWSLMAVYVEDAGLGPSQLSVVLSLGTVAGLLVQLPTGWLADRYGRRHLILAQTGAGAVVAAAVAILDARSFPVFLLLIFLFCLLIGPLYALGVAQTNDYIERREFVAASSGLLFAWGIGSSVGPVIASAFMQPLGGRGLFVFLALALAGIAAFVLLRMRVRPPQPRPARFVAVPASTGTRGAPELDPRSEPGLGDHPSLEHEEAAT